MEDYVCGPRLVDTTVDPFPFDVRQYEKENKSWTEHFLFDEEAVIDPNDPPLVRRANKMSWIPIYEYEKIEYNNTPRQFYSPVAYEQKWLHFDSDGAMFASNLRKTIFVARPSSTKYWYFYFGNNGTTRSNESNLPQMKVWRQVESGFKDNFTYGMKAVILENSYPFGCYNRLDRFPYTDFTTRSVCFYGWDRTEFVFQKFRDPPPVVKCSLIEPAGQTPPNVSEDFDRTNAPLDRSNFAIAADKKGFFIHGGVDKTKESRYSSEFSDFWYYKAPDQHGLSSNADKPGWHRLPSGPGLCTTNCTDARCEQWVESNQHESCRRSDHTLVPVFENQDAEHPTVLLLFGGTWKEPARGRNIWVNRYSNALWEYDVNERTWRVLDHTYGTTPTPRSGHSAVVTTDQQIPVFKQVMRIFGGTSTEATIFENPRRLGLPLCDTWKARRHFCMNHRFWDADAAREYDQVSYDGPCADWNYDKAEFRVQRNASKVAASMGTSGKLALLGCVGRDSNANKNEIFDYYIALETWKNRVDAPNDAVVDSSRIRPSHHHQAAVLPGGMLVYGSKRTDAQIRSGPEIDYMHFLLDIMNLDSLEVWNDTSEATPIPLNKSVTKELPIVKLPYSRGVKARYSPYLDPLDRVFLEVKIKAGAQVEDLNASKGRGRKTLLFENAGNEELSIAEILQGVEPAAKVPGTVSLQWDSATFVQTEYRDQKLKITTRIGEFKLIRSNLIFQMRSEDIMYDAALNLVSYELETQVPECGKAGSATEVVWWIPRRTRIPIKSCKCRRKPLDFQDVCVPCHNNFCGDCGPGYLFKYSNISSITNVTQETEADASATILGVESQCFPCPAGRYRDLYDVEGQSFTETCTPCPHGRFQPFTGQTACRECKLPNSDSELAKLIKCPADANGSRTHISPGRVWWRLRPHSYEFVECPRFQGRKTGCWGGNQCKEGQQGFLCGSCAPGYTRRAMGWLCDKCGDESSEILKLISACLLLFVLFAYAWHKIVSCRVTADSSSVQDVVIKIIVNHFALLQSTRIWDYYGVTSLSGLWLWGSWECTLRVHFHDKTYWTQDKIDMLLSFAIYGIWILVSLGYAAVGFILSKRNDDPVSGHDRTFRTGAFKSRFVFSFVVFYFLFYDYMLRIFLHTFSSTIPTEWDKEWRSKYNPSFAPFSDRHIGMWRAALGSIIVYCGLIPPFLCRRMYLAHKYEGMGGLDMMPTWMFFESGYELRLRYWDFVLFGRRTLTGFIWAMPFFPDNDGTLRTSLQLVASIAFLVLHVSQSPFDNRVRGGMDTLEKDSLIAWSAVCMVDAVTSPRRDRDRVVPDWLMTCGLIFLELRFITTALLLIARRDLPRACLKFIPKKYRYHFRPNIVVFNTKSGHIDASHLQPEEMSYLSNILAEIHEVILQQPVDKLKSFRLGGTLVKAFSAACKADFDIQQAKKALRRQKEEKKKEMADMNIKKRKRTKILEWFHRHRVDSALEEDRLEETMGSFKPFEHHGYPANIRTDLANFHPRIMALAGKVFSHKDPLQGTGLTKFTEKEKEKIERMIGRMEVTAKNIKELSLTIRQDAQSMVLEARSSAVYNTHNIAFEWLNFALPEPLLLINHAIEYQPGKALRATRAQKKLAIEKHRALRLEQYPAEAIKAEMLEHINAARRRAGRSATSTTLMGEEMTCELRELNTEVLTKTAQEEPGTQQSLEQRYITETMVEEEEQQDKRESYAYSEGVGERSRNRGSSFV